MKKSIFLSLLMILIIGGCIFADVGKTENFAPTKFMASGDSALQMTLTFEKTAGSTVCIQVLDEVGTYQTLTENATSPYVIKNLEEHTSYEYRAYAVKDGVKSKYVYTTGRTPYEDIYVVIVHDNIKPIIQKTNVIAGGEYIISSDTVVLKFKVTDKTYNANTFNLTANDVIVKVAGNINTDANKVLSMNSIENGIEYTLTLSNITKTGKVTCSIPAGKFIDKAGNANDETIIDLGVSAMENPISDDAPSISVDENVATVTCNQVSIFGIEKIVYKYRETGTTTYTEVSKNEFTLPKANTSYEIITCVTDKKGVVQESKSTTVRTSKMDSTIIKITASPETLTNGDVNVSINFGGSKYGKEYSLDNSNWTSVTTNEVSFTVTENKTIYARFKDSANNASTSKTLVIDYIDKEKPIITSVSVTPEGNANTKNVLVSGISDVGVAGIKGYYISDKADLSNAKWTSFTGTEFTYTAKENKKYYIWVADNANNISAAKEVTISGIVAKVSNINVSSNITLKAGGEATLEVSYSGMPESISYIISKNGIITFDETTKKIRGLVAGDVTITVRFKDYDGAYTDKVVNVKVQDLVITVVMKADNVLYDGEWTNKDVVATLTVDGECPTTYKEKIGATSVWTDPKNIEIDTNTGIAKITYEEDVDAQIYYQGYNADGKAVTEVNGPNVIKVDKKAPTEGTVSMTSTTNAVNVIISGATDAGAGIKEYDIRIYKDGNLIQKYVSETGTANFTELKSSTNYEVKYKIIDKLGNETNLISAGTIKTKEVVRIVTYMVDGSVYKTRESYEWQEADLTLEASKTGYEFKGWSKTENGRVLESLIIEEEDVTLYAVFKDETAPTIVGKKYQTINGELQIIVEAEDDGSGISHYCATTNSEAPSEWLPIRKDENGSYIVTVPGTNTYYVWIRDAEGNYASFVQTAIKDIFAPTGTIKAIGTNEENGLAYSNKHNITLNITAEDNESSANDISIAVYNEEDYINITSYSQITYTKTYKAGGLEIPWTTSANDGLKRIYVIFKDKAGNISITVKDVTELVSANYKINYYMKNIAGTTYELVESITKSGRTDIEQNVSEIVKTLEGATFEKATTIENGVSIGEKYKVSSDGKTEIYLYYTRNKYTVTLDADGGEVSPATLEITYEDKIGELPTPTKSGHVFLGWYTGVGEKVTEDLVIKSARTIYAHWSSNTYTITFNSNGGTEVESISLEYGKEIIKPTNPTKNGYIFNGWNPELPTTMPAQNITVTATWTAEDYIISYNLNGGSLETANPVSYNIESNDITLSNPTKEGFDFAGWTGTNLASETKTVVIKKGETGNRSYTANWTKKTYTITFDTNGGSAIEQMKLAYGETIVAPANPTKVGNEFVGWTPAIPETMPAENITITANWKVKTYLNQIQHIIYGGSGTNYVEYIFKTTTFSKEYGESYTIDNSFSVTNPNGACIDHYGSLGYTDDVWQAYYNGDTVTQPNKTVVINAYYRVYNYSITYNLNGGTNSENNPSSYTVLYGVSLEEPTRTGYVFTNWTNSDGKIVTGINEFANANFTGGEDMYTKLAERTTGNQTLTANWTLDTYRLTYDLAGGTLSGKNPESYTIESNDITLVNPTKEGYDFIGWTGTGISTATESVTIKSGSTGDRSYIANWRVKGYTITFNTNGGTSIDEITGNYGDVITAPSNPTKEGYTFESWTPSIPKTMPAENMTITANWTANTYKIVYNGNGSTSGTMSNSIHTYDVEKELNENQYQKDGFVFEGWNTLQDGTGTTYSNKAVVKNLKTKQDDTLVLYAKWTPINYSITYNLNGGTLAKANPTTYTAETSVITLENPTKRGYKFIGWTGSNGDTPETTVTIKTGTTGNKTYTANWEIVKYEITYSLGGGAVSGNPTEYTIESENITLINPTKSGYEFAGWSGADLTNTSKTVIITKGSTGNRNYIANWTLESYTISYNLNGGTLANKVTEYNVNTNDITLGTPEKTGYRFLGWTGTDILDVTSEVIIRKGSTGNRTYEANWEVITYSIGYILNDGVVEKENRTTYTIETPSFELTNPTRAGYEFKGWTGTDLNEKTKTVTINKGSTGNRTYTANWEIETYTITYNLNGGVLSKSNPFNYTVKTETRTLENPTKAGYTFLGWTGSNGNIPNTTVTIEQGSTGNRTYEANWSAIEYNITYNLNGGTLENQILKYTVEDEITISAPTKNGFTFAGWTGTDLAGKTQSVKIDKGSTGDRTYTANWNELEYTITYNLNGGTETQNPRGYGASSGAITLKAPTKDGYEFIGWTGSNGDTPNVNVIIEEGSTGDKEYTANWEVAIYEITYVLNGGSIEGTNKTEYDIFTEDFTLINPTRKGYTFLGWTGTGLDEKTQTVTVEKGSSGNRTYTANWKITSYKITYELNGGTVEGENPAEYTSLSNITLINPTKEGYEFIGWTGTEITTISSSVTISRGSVGNRTYTANWKSNTYYIKYDGNGNDSGSMANTTHQYGVESSLAENTFEKTGYNMVGWNTEKDGTGTNYNLNAAVSTLTPINGATVTLYAKWEIKKYTVTFDANGGQIYDLGATTTTREVTFGKTYDEGSDKVPSAESGDDYEFIGWNTEKDGTGTTITGSTIVDETARGLILYAKWRKLEAFAIYSADDNSLTFYKNTDEVTVGETYNEKTVTAVYTGIEEDTYTSSSDVPWSEYASKITSVEFVDTISPVSTAYWFYQFTQIVTVDLENLNTSKVTDMSYMFYMGSKAIIEISGDTSITPITPVNPGDENITPVTPEEPTETMALSTNNISSNIELGTGSSLTFASSKLVLLDVSKFDTSKVTNMSYMFSACSKLITLDVSNFDTSNVTNMAGMFNCCLNIETLDVSNFDTAKVTSMAKMFNFCNNVKTLDLTNFDTSKVTSMSDMFEKMNKLEKITLGEKFSFSGSGSKRLCSLPSQSSTNIEGADGKWYDKLTKEAYEVEDVPNNTFATYTAVKLLTEAFAIYSETDNSLTFYKNSDGVTVGSTYNGKKVTAVYMGVENDSYIIGIGNIKNNSNIPWYSYRTNITTVNFKDKISPVSTAYWFCQMQKLTTINLSNLDTSNVTDMSAMFSWCRNLATINLSSFDTSNVTDMSGMFWGCTNLATLNISSFDTSNVTDMISMFSNCESLTTLNLSNFDTSNVTDMSAMFFCCKSLTTLDISNFDTSNVIDMSDMFSKSGSLTTLNLSNFDTSNVIDMESMFSSMNTLQEITLGDKFSFNGSGDTRQCSLPTPNKNYITKANGKWYNKSTKIVYAPENIPNNTSATYVACTTTSTEHDWIYIIVIDSNGGYISETGATQSIIGVTLGKTFGTIPEVESGDKYEFIGWNTKQDGTGTTITSSTVLDETIIEKMTDGLAIYAQWSMKGKCTTCNGTGYYCAGGTTNCTRCRGTGITYKECTKCDGTGKINCTGKKQLVKEISFNCSREGCSGKIKYREYYCSKCGGADYEESGCSECEGVKYYYAGIPHKKITCTKCDGEGEIEKDCSKCNGTGGTATECEHGYTEPHYSDTICTVCGGTGCK